MRITTPYGTLRVDEETSIPLTITNPIFNEQGSHSLPFSVPWCEQNLKALNSPDRHTNVRKDNIDIEVTIETPDFVFYGYINFTDNPTFPRIELSFLPNDGYLIKESVKLSLLDLEGYSYASSPTKFTTFRDLLVDSSFPSVEMAMFPVAAEENSDMDDVVDADYDNEIMVSENRIINPPHYFVQSVDYTDRFTFFLYLNHLLELISSNLGFSLKRANNDFYNDWELRQLVVLNGKEIITSPEGWFSWNQADMVPNVLVKEVILGLEKMFGAVFYVNRRREMFIWLMKNILSAAAENTTLKIKTSNFLTPKELKLSANVVESYYTQTYDRIFIADSFSFTAEDVSRIHNKIYDTDTSDPGTGDNAIVFCKTTQNYFLLSWEQIDDTTWHYTAKAFHSNYHEVITDRDAEDFKEFKSELYFTPMAPVTMRFLENTTGWRHYEDEDGIFPECKFWDISAEREFGIVTMNDLRFPFTLAFNRGKVLDLSLEYDWNGDTEHSIPHGSTDVYLPDGTKDIFNYALRFEGTYGLRAQFFEEIEAHYKNSNIPLELYPSIEILKYIDTPQKKLWVDNIHVFWNEIKLTLKPNQLIVDSITAVTAKPYDERVEPVIATPIKYGLLYNWWVAEDASSKLIPAAMQTEGWRMLVYTDVDFLINNIGGDVNEKSAILRHSLYDSCPLVPLNSINYNGKISGKRLSDGSYNNNGHYIHRLHDSRLYSTFLSCVVINSFNSFNDNTKRYGQSIRLVRNATTEEKAAKSDGDSCGYYYGNDGKIYRTFFIGEDDLDNAKVWLADNLAETMYNDDTYIPGFDGGVYTPITDAAWAALTTPALCAYDDEVDNI